MKFNTGILTHNAHFTKHNCFFMGIILLFFCQQAAFSQTPPLRKYWIEFTDKKNTPFCTCRPAEFLSARALERRARAGIIVSEEDLPVSPDYIAALRAKGARLHGTSRWLNAATVVADSSTAAALRTYLLLTPYNM